MIEEYQSSGTCATVNDKSCNIYGICECTDKKNILVDDECSIECFYYSIPFDDSNYQTSIADCNALGGALVSARDDFHFKYLQDMSDEMQVQLYVSLYRQKTWSWLSGTYLTFESTKWKEMDNLGGDNYFIVERCAVIVEEDNTSLLKDVDCSLSLNYICEFDVCKPNENCTDPNKVFSYNDVEHNVKGIYATPGTCVNKSLFKEKCNSEASCRSDLGLVCSDIGCVCDLDNRYWNYAIQNCTTKENLCSDSELVCGACVKPFISPVLNFYDANDKCTNTTEFHSLHRIRNEAQWLYDVFFGKNKNTFIGLKYYSSNFRWINNNATFDLTGKTWLDSSNLNTPPSNGNCVKINTETGVTKLSTSSCSMSTLSYICDRNDDKLQDQVTTSTDLCSTISDKKCSADGFCQCVNSELIIYDDPNKSVIEDECYKECFDYSTTNYEMTWDNAKIECESLGGKLASIRDKLHRDVIESIFDVLQNESFFLGAKTYNVAGNWSWLSGLYLKSVDPYWKLGEPSLVDIEKSCLSMDPSKNFTEKSCSSGTQRFICEFDECQISEFCPPSQYYTYNEPESGNHGIYGTPGKCVAILSFYQPCISHRSCDGSKLLKCTDDGCQCGITGYYGDGKTCLTKQSFCSNIPGPVEYACGSCFKVLNSTKSNYNSATSQCENFLPVSQLMIARNEAQKNWLKASAEYSGKLWIGLKSIETSPTNFEWRWLDGNVQNHYIDLTDLWTLPTAAISGQAISVRYENQIVEFQSDFISNTSYYVCEKCKIFSN
jgi:hypothetical protein